MDSKFLEIRRELLDHNYICTVLIICLNFRSWITAMEPGCTWIWRSCAQTLLFGALKNIQMRSALKTTYTFEQWKIFVLWSRQHPHAPLHATGTLCWLLAVLNKTTCNEQPHVWYENKPASWARILLVLWTIFHDEKSFQSHRKNLEIFETEYWYCILPPACWVLRRWDIRLLILCENRSNSIYWNAEFSQRDMAQTIFFKLSLYFVES